MFVSVVGRLRRALEKVVSTADRWGRRLYVLLTAAVATGRWRNALCRDGLAASDAPRLDGNIVLSNAREDDTENVDIANHDGRNSESRLDVDGGSGIDGSHPVAFETPLLERSVRVTTPALGVEALGEIRDVKTQVVIGDRVDGLPDVRGNDSGSREEIAELESSAETTEKNRVAVNAIEEIDQDSRPAIGNDYCTLSVATDPTACPPAVYEENVKLFTSCKILPRKNAHWEMSNYMKTVNRFLNKKPQEQTSIGPLIKYWTMQKRLFSRFSMGILLDEESFYSVCPEVLCSHIALMCQCDTIVDPFCGAGGNIIQFTETCSRVIGVDLDPNKIRLARNNAKVYGVQHRIRLRTGDYFRRDRRLRADVVFMSPPWGGPEYVNKPAYSLVDMCSEHGGGRRILEIAREIAPKIAIHLPRNLDKNECVMLARDLNFKYVLFENNYIGNKLNSTTVYLK